MQQFDSVSLNRAVNALDNKDFVKLICGASNTDSAQIKRLALVYSLAEVDVIDISANMESYNSAKAGIAAAKEIYYQNTQHYKEFNEPLIMVSLNSGNDPHFRKATFDFTKCTQCLKCTYVCPAHALYIDNKKLQFNVKSCYGCGRCTEACKNNAVYLDSNNEEFFIPDDIEAVEIHTGNSSTEEVKKFIDDNSFILKTAGLVSFSVESCLFGKNELIQYVQSLIPSINKKIIIQIDGRPMGASNDVSSSLQAMASAQILSEINQDFYIQIAGGVNHLTKKYLKMFNLRVNGIGYGTFARKIILPYIVGLSDAEFYSNLKKCVNITTNLVDKYGKSFENVV